MTPETLSKLEAQYNENEKEFIGKTSKAEAITQLHQLEARIEAMPDFDRFPEGAMGVIIYAKLLSDSEICPDVGDFNYMRQAYEKILQASYNVIAEESDEF